MLAQNMRQLEPNAITQLCSSTAQEESILVQVYNLVIHKDKLNCVLSDGHYCVKAFLKDKSIIFPEKHEYAIICIKQHMVSDTIKKLGVINFELVCQYSQLIGQPTPFDFDSSNHNLNPTRYSIDQSKVTAWHTRPKDITMTQVNSNIKSGVKRQERGVKRQEQTAVKNSQVKRQMRMPQNIKAPTSSGNVKDYQTIKGLFIGLKNWHLLCRITKLDYQQFNKKGGDKLVKLLNIQLMDRSQVKIAGVFFYQAAQKFRDELKLNSVYKISQGSISNENYNNSKNDKMSPFRIVFGMNSVFEEVSDVHAIARPQQAAITLNQLLNNPIYEQQYDIVAILVQIEQPKQFIKNDKPLLRINWVVVDPIQQKSINVVLWNQRIKPDRSMIGRTVLLGRFALHNYNGSLTLNSKIRSSVQVVGEHSYQRYQQSSMQNWRNYPLLSQKRARQQDPNMAPSCRTLYQLSNAISMMSSGDVIRSDLNVWVNRILTKKWYYQGCPACNKAAEKGMSCTCGKFVQQTVPHFIMTVQLCDMSGAVYTTAYDDNAKRIFWNQQGVIYKLMKLDVNQLRDVTQDYLYQEFKVRLVTKKDEEGRIKHHMGRLQLKPPEKSAQQNVQMIKQMMGLSVKEM